eukprot:5691364-Pyramimonas_sp.AAC.1
MQRPEQRSLTVAVVVRGNPNCRGEACLPGARLTSPSSWWERASMTAVAGARTAELRSQRLQSA